MGRQPCCDKVGLKKGPWTAEEDQKLVSFLLNNGQCCWRTRGQQRLYKHGLFAQAFQFLPLLVVLLLLGRSVE